jgi:hypothetical protein
MTRRSGFTVHQDTTGGEFRRLDETSYALNKGEQIKVSFRLSGHSAGDLLGYGLWFWHTSGFVRSITGGPETKTLTEYSGDSWNKMGSIWKAENATPVEVTFTIIASIAAEVALCQPICGRIRHKYLDDARPALLRNMYDFAPEAIFPDGEIEAV